MFRTRMYNVILGATMIATSIGAGAAAPTFQITELFSNLDGSVQFVRLTETAGLDGQNHFTGLKLTSSHDGVTKEFTFTHDLPEQTAHVSIVVAAPEHVAREQGYLPILLSLPGGWSCCFPVDFQMPERFLATDGGTVDFAGVDAISYSSLPTDSANGLLRDGSAAPALLPGPRCPVTNPPGGCPVEPQIADVPSTAVEYYNGALGQYFVSASAPDIDALDSARIAGWQRTGFTFPAAATALFAPGARPPMPSPQTMLPVCRFYLPPGYGNSHFLSASPEECAQVHDRYPAFVLESAAAFYAALPDLATGECPPPYYDSNDDMFSWLPVFRLWNAKADTNHRYTTNPFVRSTMIEQGYISEGYGPAGVAFCVSAENLP